MKYIAIAAIWLSYALMAVSAIYWSGNPGAILVTLFFGGIFAVVSTSIVANTK